MFTVHIEQLRRVGMDVGAISTRLRENARTTLAQGLAGNGPVTDAMHSVEKDWSRQRRTICAHLDGVAGGAQAAANLYAAVEAALEKAMRAPK